jgi:CHASE1-domain containing sensor protein/two-component sensor histidine kinase
MLATRADGPNALLRSGWKASVDDLRKHFALALFAVVAVISLVMAGFAYVAAQNAARIKFEAAADEALNRIESRVELHLGLLRNTLAFFSAHADDVSPEEFQAFFDALAVANNYGGLRGLGLAAIGRRGEAEALDRLVARRHGEDAGIHPPSDGEWLAPILLYEPTGPGGRTPIGFDMYSDPARREAILAAWESGEPRASSPVNFDPEQSSPRDVLVFSRLDPKADNDTGQGRRGGLLFAVLRTENLFNVALDKFPVLPVQAAVYDGNPAAANLLFRSAALPDASFGPELAVTRPLSVAGRLWTVEFRPTALFAQPSSRGMPVLLGILGLLLAGAIALVARYHERAYAAAALLHESAEKSLLEKELMLQEMKHRIKNSISRVLAIARQTAGSAADLEDFTKSFSARLQAMAASQDMLTRSRWQMADLSELLRIELGQVFGKELPEDLLDGPKVMLSEAATQALGLTFHELATNALKHGEAGHSSERLRVRWNVEARNRLRMIWSESGGRPVKPPEKPGFGTRLIDMNIRRELGGTIDRSYDDQGLRIEIVVPLGSDPT